MASSNNSTLPLLMSLSFVAATSADEESSKEEKSSRHAGSWPRTPKRSALVIKNTFIELSDRASEPQASRRAASAPPSRAQSNESTPGEACFEQALPKVHSWVSDVSTSAHGDDDAASELCSNDGSSSLPLARTRQKLRASAALYMPNSTPVCTEWAWAPSPEIRVPPWMEVVTTSCQTALRECELVHHVQLREAASGFGFAIVGSIKAMHGLQAAKCSLAFAGDQMLSVTKQSKQVHMIGAGKNPFTPLHVGVGFSVQLAFVEDEDSACWNLLHKGFCSRGCACWWQHPHWQVPVTVEIEFTH